MRTASLVVLVPNLVGILEPFSHVVGIEQGNSRDVRETVSSEHLHVGPGDGQDRGGSVRCSRNGQDGLASTRLDNGMARKERC